jgi:hypothetical protein
LTVVVGKDGSHNHLKITQHSQLDNNGTLELPEGGGSLAVLEAKGMDQVTMNLGGVPRPVNIIQHLSSAGKDRVTRCEFLEESTPRFVLIARKADTKRKIPQNDSRSEVSSTKGVYHPTELQDLMSQAWNFVVIGSMSTGRSDGVEVTKPNGDVRKVRHASSVALND